jgi:three-Cys-motif partner protein
MVTRHEFGGPWTRVKLERIETYLPFFTGELGNDYPTVYFDAFAGTDTVDRRKPKKSALKGFYNIPDPLPIDGSARRTLETSPPFKRYILVDHQQAKCGELRRLRNHFPHLSGRVRVRRGDGNECVKAFFNATDWTKCRAAFFLDPYGMQVHWNTVEAIAATKAADM